MRIVHAYQFDATDVAVQSGRPYFLQRRLEAEGCTVVPAFPLSRALERLYDWKVRWYRWRGLAYHPDREPRVLRSLARQVERRIAGQHADVIFSSGSHVLAELNTGIPKVLVADATFANVLDRYPAFTGCAPDFVALGHEQERRALANCAAAIFPSEWAATAAREIYGAPAERVHVVPFGASSEGHDAASVGEWITGRSTRELRLLFVGRDWLRKGGDTVLATARELARWGVPLRVDLVGENDGAPVPAYARHHGFLRKDCPRERRLLHELFAEAHFFFVPSRAENYGLAFCEAAAHGLPSITTAVGGIPTIVRDGETGRVLAPDSSPTEFASAILAAFADPRRYREMAEASLADFEARLNWGAFTRRFLEILDGVVA